ncbi:transglycosylase SLT domain-containing protein [Massilia sp. IC2-476]|uniref:transglycosylase SLT domain-containing protein n=1 Tax=Massilia sp. IC2-476 TaxID=2887199 RepID=UPI001D1281EC|nr:transglycosylase SLT domain-containing protein [Massilia sp. IC2-476]MCC2971561.1 transglycosylase SLT domain-containing protein [Massilia sp. IC2-476]
MKPSVKARLLVALCAALAGAAASPLAFADGKPVELTVSAKQYKQYFREASNEFNVPVELLQSIAYAETRWHPHVPKGKLKKNGEPEVEVESHEGMPISYGIMGLRDDNHFGHSLREGAALIRVTPEQAASDTRSNIRAAAALLAQYGARKNKAFPLEDWEAAVARYSGIPQPEIAKIYSYEVLTAIRQGRRSDKFEIDQKHVEMEKVYGKDKLRKLSARRITIETGTPDPKISAPDFADTPNK